MSVTINQYVDEEFVKIQQFIGMLVDTLPPINLDDISVSTYFLRNFIVQIFKI